MSNTFLNAWLENVLSDYIIECVVVVGWNIFFFPTSLRFSTLIPVRKCITNILLKNVTVIVLKCCYELTLSFLIKAKLKSSDTLY